MLLVSSVGDPDQEFEIWDFLTPAFRIQIRDREKMEIRDPE
jgi:hypothetical protein